MSIKLARRELDRQLRQSSVMAVLARPSGGWVRAVREVLAMSQRDLADRLNQSQAAVAGYESREVAGSLQISTLARVAEEMDCELVYGFVPRNGTFQETVNRKARQIAVKELAPLAQNMQLEGQGVNAERYEEMVEDRIEEIISSKRLWKS